MWVLLTGREVGLVYLHTQLFPLQKHLQDKPIDRDIMLITAIGVPMVEGPDIMWECPNFCQHNIYTEN